MEKDIIIDLDNIEKCLMSEFEKEKMCDYDGYINRSKKIEIILVEKEKRRNSKNESKRNKKCI